MMSTHKLTAGDGYLYLVRQTAAHDAEKRGRTTLADYYTDKGETPGEWTGRGLSAFGDPVGREFSTDTEAELWRIDPGSQVTEDQMRALFGLGLHPNAGRIAEHLILRGAGKAAATAAVNLGRPFLINDASTELQRRLAVAFRDHNLSTSRPWNAPIDEALRARLRTDIARDMFAAEYGRLPSDERELTGFIATQSRDQTTSTAGYDLTFSPVKSFSVLWALAPLELSKTLEQCHDRAVADTLEFLQDHAAFTRIGAQGVAQLDTEGFIAARFVHRDSRAGDPDLHTHIAVSNKVRAIGADGVPRWLAVDGRPLFKTTVAASEFYNTRLEAYATELAGVVFEERPATERGKRPVREIVGIPTDLCEMFSTRRALIRDRYTDLAKRFQFDHGREPTTIEAIALHQQATLETRVAKHEPRSLAEQRQQWRTQAIEHLGSQHALSTVLVGIHAQLPLQTVVVTPEWVAQQARLVVDTVSASRSSWQRVHVYAEAQRRIRNTGMASDSHLAESITAAALAEPLSRAHARIVDSDLGEPDVLRRRDGASVYTTHGTALFTSVDVLAAEKRILRAAGQRDGRRIDDETVDLALLGLKTTRGRELNPGQRAVVREMACSGARVQLALAPAGSGKTTAMAALARAWEESGGTVLGLSPGANQAQLLREDIGAECDTVDKFIWLHQHPDAHNDPARQWFDAIDENTLIILDEAGKAGTRQLDAVITTALARGASVRLIGDDQQLASMSAGGVLRDIDATHGALTLSEVIRFRSRAEAHAGLALRDGDPAGLAFYADYHRIHVGSDDTVIDQVYQAWSDDRNRGFDSAMLAPTNDIVTQLNERARLDRLTRITESGSPVRAADVREAQLADGLRASVGDIVATRRNRRTLRLGGTDFVRNGYRWRVDNVTRDGALTVARLDTGQKAVLPAWYVRAHVTLGYASTIDASQGMTIGNKTTTGTCHVVGSDRLTRQQLYTAMTRATDGSHVYLATAETDAHNVLTPKATHPDTALDVLQRVLARDGAAVSATTEQRRTEDPFQRIGHASRMYVHAIGALAEHHLGAAAMAAIDAAAKQVQPNLTAAGGWSTLRLHLALLAIAGHDPIKRLEAAAAQGDLTNAADPAAVLDYRLEPGADTRDAGPLRWLPPLPEALIDSTDWADYLHARRDLVTTLADRIRYTAAGWDATTAPRWARPLLDANAGVRAEIAVFRAAHDVPDPDTRLTGPEQYATRDRRAQNLLEDMAAREIGHTAPDHRRFHYLDRLDPRIRRDPYWPQLANRLTEVARTDVDVRRLVADAAADGPLPDQMPGAALWWRLAGRLHPAALETRAEYLRPDWLPDLHRVFGSATAGTIVADPAFGGLVAAIDTADPERWTPIELLQLAHEHLRDHDDTLRRDEYARLLTYSIDLFATPNPYDHIDIPAYSDADIPVDTDEEEALIHQVPDPSHAPTVPPDDVLLEMLGLGHGGHLIPPTDLEDLPPDLFDYDTDDFALTFDDLLTERPAPRPLNEVVADVRALREAKHRATEHLRHLQDRVRRNDGPAVRAAAELMAELRERAAADRPYAIAVQDVLARWADADTDYQHALDYARYTRDQLALAEAEAEADADIDRLDVESARAAVKLATFAIPDVSPAERFHRELTGVMAERAEAAGGADRIVTDGTVEAARKQAIADDAAAVAAARAHRDRLRTDLDRAEAATAKAFAEADARTTDYVLDHIDQLHTELAMLRAAGDYRIERAIHIDPDAVSHLPDLTARGITNLARSGFTVTAVHAGDLNTTRRALAVLQAAASAQDRTILWCSPTDKHLTRPIDCDDWNSGLSLAHVHGQVCRRERQIDSSTTIVVEYAAQADPAILVDLADHVAEHHARLILLDGDDCGRPSAPSRRIFKLLQQDLPWSVTLTVDEATPARSAARPDVDPVIDHAARCDRAPLPSSITTALNERDVLRLRHAASSRLDADIWRVIETRLPVPTPGLER
ncbi:MobF family relaxase [Mycolicibacterium arenosum]|uniref:Relaxase domain-containing protein n=1 Tax=Mycolicibacterium arenosum TaxID=2952157 RepID=A0ABT1MC99_9MYCO|nr:MobF family relaxase [Mycolicibacterium sp. CAU 1645]MCP9276799.1 relaxase domain-containing protein [Mycolicibacterium sp. CAU 1645]